MNIEKELKLYSFYKKREKYLIKERLKLLSPFFLPDSVIYYKSPTFDNTIISEMNKFHSIVENAGIKAHNLSLKIKEKIRRIEKEIFFLQDKIHTINILLTDLDAQELFVIQHKYFIELSWKLLAIKYQTKFGNSVSIDTLKRMKKTVLKKMLEVLR